MIIGIGTDICDIRRIKDLIDKHESRFLDKVFSKNERMFCDKRAARIEGYAKRFAAKEAVAKALAGANTGALSWQDVEVVNSPSGRPEIVLHGEALARIEKTAQGKKWQINLSLSDEPPYALAFVIVSVS